MELICVRHLHSAGANTYVDFNVHLTFTAIFIVVVSCSVFCCLRVYTEFHLLEGSHEFSTHRLNADRS